jgi:uncharacterized protein (TIGR02231 family)
MYPLLVSITTLLQPILVCMPLMVMSPGWRMIQPADFNEAIELNAPIDQVTVYHGHATVHRESQVTLDSEGTLFRLPDLPRDAQEVKVAARGADVLRIIQARRVRQSLGLKALEVHVIAIETLSKEMRALAARLESPKTELTQLKMISTAQLKSGKRGQVVLNKRAQKTRRDYQRELESRQLNAHRELQTLHGKIEERAVRYQTHWDAIRELTVNSRPREVLEVYALIRPKRKARVALAIKYRVPNVTWTPKYELHVKASQGTLKLRFGVKVSQSTGEDWRDVRLRVSTGDELLILNRPQLNTWLLSEQQ